MGLVLQKQHSCPLRRYNGPFDQRKQQPVSVSQCFSQCFSQRFSQSYTHGFSHTDDDTYCVAHTHTGSGYTYTGTGNPAAGRNSCSDRSSCSSA